MMDHGWRKLPDGRSERGENGKTGRCDRTSACPSKPPRIPLRDSLGRRHLGGFRPGHEPFEPVGSRGTRVCGGVPDGGVRTGSQPGTGPSRLWHAPAVGITGMYNPGVVRTTVSGLRNDDQFCSFCPRRMARQCPGQSSGIVDGRGMFRRDSLVHGERGAWTLLGRG